MTGGRGRQAPGWGDGATAAVTAGPVTAVELPSHAVGEPAEATGLFTVVGPVAAAGVVVPRAAAVGPVDGRGAVGPGGAGSGTISGLRGVVLGRTGVR